MGVIYELYGIPVYDDDIYHSGIKGMHWGIRRYQNPDGTLTPEGRKRYNVGSDGNLYDKETGKKYGLSTKAKVGIGAGAAALAGGAALAADQIFNGGRGRQAIGQFVGNTAQKVGNWAGDRAQDVSDWWTGENNGTRAMRGNAEHYNKLANVTKDWDANVSNGYSQRADMLNKMADKYASGGVSDKISNAANWVGDQAQNAWNGARDTAGQVGNWVGNRAQDVGNWAKDTATDFWKGQETGRVTPNGNAIRTGGAREILNNAGDWVKDTYNDVGDWATKNFGTDRQQMERFRNYDVNTNNIGNQIRNGVSNAADWVGDRAQDVGNWVSDTYNNAREGVSNWFNGSSAPQASQAAPSQPQAPSSVQRPIDISDNLLTVGQSAGNSGGFEPMSTRNYNIVSERRSAPGLSGVDLALNTTIGGLNGGLSARNAYEAAKAEGYSDADARRIATGAGLGAGLTSTAAGLAGTVGDRALGNRFTWIGAGGQIAGALGGNAAGNAIARKAVGPSSYMSELNNKIGQRVTLENGQTGIFRGWSTLPDGRVVPILE